MYIKICSIKKLKYIFDDVDCTTVGAILCSSYHIYKSEFESLNSFIAFGFDDIFVVGESSFNSKIANDIKNYVDGLSKQIEILYVFCDSGESISTALAAAITRYIGEKDWYIWNNPQYHPNLLVYRIQCEVFGLKISKLKIRRLVHANDIALKRAIKKVNIDY